MVEPVVTALSTIAHRLTRPGYDIADPSGEPAFGLPAAPAARFRARLARLDDAAGDALAATVARATPLAARYLRRAFAAGHEPATVEWLAAQWAASGDDWVRANVGRFDPPEPGPVRHGDGRLSQCDQRTCGPSVVVVARMIADPAFGHRLAVAPTAAFGAAQLRVHRAANVVWPRAAGTTPWGVAATLNVHSGAFGARYSWRPVDPASPATIRAALGAATRAAELGWPVPLLIGRWEPRHWVLVVGSGADTVLCYEPGRGRVVEAGVAEIVAGRANPLGYPNLQAVVLPTRREPAAG